jgi:hypothetical protein
MYKSRLYFFLLVLLLACNNGNSIEQKSTSSKTCQVKDSLFSFIHIDKFQREKVRRIIPELFKCDSIIYNNL